MDLFIGILNIGSILLAACAAILSVILVKRIIEMDKEDDPPVCVENPSKFKIDIFNYCVSMVIAHNLRARMYSGWCDG